MPFPIKTCVVCEEEFELKPDKPGFANRCRRCSSPEAEGNAAKQSMTAEERASAREADSARRAAIRILLYSRK